MLARRLLQIYGFCLLAGGIHATDELLVADAGKGSIIRTAIKDNTFTVEVDRIKVVKRPTDIAYDPEDNRVYWIDENTSSICRRELVGDSAVETILNKIQSKGLAIDTRRKKIFWTNVEQGTIVSANLDGSNQTEVIKTEGVDSPSKVLVDSKNRYLYWVGSQEASRVERATINGTNEIVLLNTTFSITNLALDPLNNTLYLASKSSNVIQAFSLTKNDSKLQFLFNISVANISGIAVSDQYMYWTNGSFVYRANKITGKDVTPVHGKFILPTDIVVIKTGQNEGGTSQSPSPTSSGKVNSECMNNGILKSSGGVDKSCVCPKEFIGKLCQVSKEDALPYAVFLTFKNDHSSFDKEVFKKTIAKALTLYCSNNTCNQRIRRKRDESPSSSVHYKEDDIIIFSGYPKPSDDQWLVKFVAMQRIALKEEQIVFVDKKAITEAIKENRVSVERSLGVQILRVDSKVFADNETHIRQVQSHPTAPELIAAATLASIVCVILAVAAMFFIRRRRKSHDVEDRVQESPNYAFYDDEEFQLPIPPPPPPPPPQVLTPTPPPVPSNPPPVCTITAMEHEEDSTPQEDNDPRYPLESWTVNPLHIQAITRLQNESDGPEVSLNGSILSLDGGVKNHFKRFKASFKRKSNREVSKSHRNNSAPIKQRRTLERNSLPRPHSDVLPKTMHHVYDVPRLRPQRAPLTLWAQKPQLPPKERKYTIERTPSQVMNPDSVA